MNIRENNNKTVLDEIFILKGMAITGLIIWHTYLPIINISVYNFLLKITKPYIMPIFMFSSGLLFAFSRTEISSFSEYRTLVTTKFQRLMIPYFIIALTYIAAEFIAEFAGPLISISHHVDRNSWKYILFYPFKMVALHLWFLYDLFFVFLLFPILNKLIRNHLVLFLFIFSLWIAPIPSFSYFNHGTLREFLLFFYLGYLYSHIKLNNIDAYSKYLCIVLLGLLVLLSTQGAYIKAFLNIFSNDHIINKLFIFISVLPGILFYYYLSKVIKNNKNPLFHILKYLGIYSTAIYLYHHISIVIVRIFLLNVLNLNTDLYPLLSVIIFLSGIFLPVLFTNYIINKSKILPPLLLGTKKASQYKVS